MQSLLIKCIVINVRGNISSLNGATRVLVIEKTLTIRDKAGDTATRRIVSRTVKIEDTEDVRRKTSKGFVEGEREKKRDALPRSLAKNCEI